MVVAVQVVVAVVHNFGGLRGGGWRWRWWRAVWWLVGTWIMVGHLVPMSTILPQKANSLTTAG